MKFAKTLMIMAFVLLLGVGSYLIFGKSEKLEMPGFARGGQNNTSRNQPGRADDPTYADELRVTTAVMQETQKNQEALQKKIEAMQEDAKREKDNADQKIASLQADLKKAQEQVQSLSGEGASAVRDELSGAISTMTEGIAALNQELKRQSDESNRKIAALQKELQAARQEGARAQLGAQATGNGNAQQDNSGNAGESPGRRSVYAQAGIVTPYGKTKEEMDAMRAANQAKAQTDASSVERWLQEVGSTVNDLAGSVGTSSSHDGRAANANARNGQTARRQEWETVFPVYTLPQNTILADAVLLTPMIGRVPLGRQTLNDPYFFRVEIGPENLAANGHRIPGVAKMIAGGYATGVREQQCARGYIDSLTFIFVDGTIVEHGAASGQGASNGQAIGWLSDPWGKPCIRGKYIDNASQYIKSRGAAAFLEAAAEGLAQGQVSYGRDSEGGLSAMLSGDVWQFVFGRGVSGTAAEYAKYVQERTANAIDVIYVEQGQSVQIMLDKQIPIDYDAKARKVNYYTEPKRRKTAYD